MNELDITQLNMDEFKDKVLMADGHSLFGSEFYDSVGFPEGYLPVIKHESGDGPKETIFVDGAPVKFIYAVYHLDLLTKVVSSLGLAGPTARGRGFAARQCVDAINEHLEAQTQEEK